MLFISSLHQRGNYPTVYGLFSLLPYRSLCTLALMLGLTLTPHNLVLILKSNFLDILVYKLYIK